MGSHARGRCRCRGSCGDTLQKDAGAGGGGGRDVLLGRGVSGGSFPKPPKQPWVGSGCWGRAVFALHRQALISSVCLLLPGWRLLLGLVGERCGRASGCYCRGRRVGWELASPSQRAVPGSSCRKLPSVPASARAFVLTRPHPLRSAPAPVRGGAGSGAAAAGPRSACHPAGQPHGVPSPPHLSFPTLEGFHVTHVCLLLTRLLLPSLLS